MFIFIRFYGLEKHCHAYQLALEQMAQWWLYVSFHLHTRVVEECLLSPTVQQSRRRHQAGQPEEFRLTAVLRESFLLPFLSFHFLSFNVLSISFLSNSFHFLSFLIPSFPFASVPLFSFPFLYLPFISFTFPSFPFFPSLSLNFLSFLFPSLLSPISLFFPSFPLTSFPFLSLPFPSFPFLPSFPGQDLESNINPGSVCSTVSQRREPSADIC